MSSIVYIIFLTKANNAATSISHSFDEDKGKKPQSIFKEKYAEPRNTISRYQGWFLFCLAMK